MPGLRRQSQRWGEAQYLSDGQWTSLSDFLARIAIAGVFPLVLYAAGPLRHVLEDEGRIFWDLQSLCLLQRLGKLDAGSYAHSLSHAESEDEAFVLGALWTCEKKVYRERWSLWKSRFEWLSTRDGMEEEVCKWAKQAYNAMKCLDQRDTA